MANPKRRPAYKKCSHGGCDVIGEVQPNKPEWFCQTHRCTHPRCEKAKEPERGSCTAHLHCAATRRSCPGRPEPGSEFCTQHTCKIAECRRYVARNSQRCKEHIPCEQVGAEGCDQFRMRRRNDIGFESYCDKHIPCRSNECCGFAQGDSLFCRMHECLIGACKERRQLDSNYCNEHTCQHRNCSSAVSYPEISSARFCPHHECHEPSCFRHALIGKDFCRTHKCAFGDCEGKRASNQSTYCGLHKCRKRGCNAEAKVQHGFCRANRHACEFPGCTHHRLDGRNMCAQHLSSPQQAATNTELDILLARQMELEEDFGPF